MSKFISTYVSKKNTVRFIGHLLCYNTDRKVKQKGSAVMPDHHDYHAFRSTTGDVSGGCSLGCLSPGMITVAVVIFLLYLIGKCG